MSDDPDIEFELVLDQHFESRVVGGDANPLVDARIRVDSKYVLGSETTYAGDYMTGHLIDELNALLGVHRGEAQTVEFSDGPLFLVLFPASDDRVTLVGCYDVKGTTPTDTIAEATVSISSWAQTIIETTELYYERMLALNPDLKNNDDLNLLSSELESTVSALEFV